MLPARLNYLHRGDVLEFRPHVLADILSGDHRQAVLKKTVVAAHSSSHVREVLRAHGGPQSKKIDIERFRTDLERSVVARAIFAKLGCRGFSYAAITDVEFAGDALRTDVNLTVALTADQELFYPMRVRSFLRRSESNHLRVAGFASIAFALCALHGDCCDVKVLQSDIARRRSSYIREHFRGWRKLLFLLVCRLAAQHVSRIRLFRADDIAEACHVDFPARERQVAVWRTVYDRTASDFNMALTEIDPPADLGLYANHPPVLVRKAYVGDISEILNEVAGR